MGKKTYKNTINLIFIAFFSLVNLAQYVVPNHFILDYWFPIFSVLFFIASFPYLNSVKIFTTLVITSWISSFITEKLFLEHFYGYDIIFMLASFKIFSVSSITGFLAAKFCLYYFEKNLLNRNKIILGGGTAVVLLVTGITVVLFNISSDNKIKEEVKKRLQLAKNISVYYNQSQNRHINNQVVIQQKLIKNLYSIKGGSISHGYNGHITISSNKLGISLIYKGIPEGEACYMFYFSDSPKIYGFNDIFVNGELVQSRANYKNIKNGKEICYESNNKVTIRYTGSYIELERASGYFK